MNNHFKIIIPFYNVEKWIGLTIKSVKAQKYTNFQCIVINDISTDNSEEVVNNVIKGDSRFVLINNKEKAYALKNIYDAIEYSNPSSEDIIITLDGDDWLASADVLSYLSDFYDKEKCWLTYGSYAEYPSGIKGKFARQIPEDIIRASSYRTSQWMTSHLRTFKYHLWNNIDVEDMKDESGKFYQMTWDLSFMFPMLEMSGNKHRYIDEILYIYNRTNPLNDDKVDHSMQLGFEREIRGKDKYDKISHGTDPLDLLNSKRFDIAAKTIYARNRMKNTDSEFPVELYLEHLKVWNNLYEKSPEKIGEKSFIDAFDNLLSDINTNGFDANKGKIPTIQGSAINGAHRIASSIVTANEVQTYEGKISEGQYNCNFQYFKNKNNFVDTGLGEIYLDEMALEFCRNKSNLYTITIFPSHDIDVANILSHINKKNEIIYCKKVTLDNHGKTNFVHNLYHNEGWIGSRQAGYPGVKEKAKLCFSKGNNIYVALVEEDNIDNMVRLKDEIRSMCNVGKHSVHINDTQEETWRIASSVYNENSVHYLNSKKITDTPNYNLYIEKYYAIINNRSDKHDFCVDSSAVLSSYGLRDCRDLDFLHLKDILSISHNIDCHNKEAVHYREKKDDIIYNPRFHFYSFGIKFASLNVVKDMKVDRNEEKDKVDVKLISGIDK